MSENVEGAEAVEPTLLDTPPVQEGAPANTETPPVEKKEEVKTGAPEKYEFKLPEGMKLDDAQSTEFSAVAKELNLTQEQAQKLVDLQAKYVEGQNKSHSENWTKTVDGWAQEARNDPEYGGAKFNESIALARTAVDKFGDKALKEALSLTGAGNHPALVRFMVKVGKAVSEDTVHKGSPPAQSIDPVKSFYPSMNK